jgi:hypothetical protein
MMAPPNKEGVIMGTAWSQINTVILLLVLFALVALIGMVASGVRGGPLDPTGTPGSTPGVRLPGTPISGPTTITQPGYYYLTNDITVTGSQNAITISTHQVTLDLGGFHIRGGGGENSVGIGTSFFVTDVEIRNGSVSNFYIGIDTAASDAARLSGIRVHDTSSRAIVVGSDGVVEQCMLYHNNGEGIVVEGAGSTIRDCSIKDTRLNGVFLVGSLNLVQGSHFRFNSWGTIDTAAVRVLSGGNIVSGNYFSDTPDDSIYITGANTRVSDNTGICNVKVKDSTATTDYYNNPCIEVVP